ncbi:tRNA (N6-isopentenyl adenosine(37)-C2)-methylthiotransferase MiaB [Sphingopyxis sp. OPL5]|uniref:tRNA (N6-isopentenyl adenosine(37)-C2)-methylthiotransferase MiaB n=1 Tax=Sphingopyxis sp. OPL5 TaxID=2486273 RepID=UPI00164E9350|nr:tRNA (N6-isopentenyl adenosine(37)-C2)-methylthiotransferase MiaB [Sphingopyxis sp. OPL5]QNO26329.1 tRNA (N6-isopentenyl adenosine(37)-C2)-methylthiotransferase MiaB [Sphingopyxis sp. OPL5]
MKSDSPKTFHIKSFGCQMNVYDGERMAEMLGARGMTAAADGADADLVVLNTCHIREKAAEKVYSDIGRLKRDDGSRPTIAVAGCVAQAEGAEIARRAPTVDVVVGPQAYHRLPDLLDRAARGEKAVDLDMPAMSKFDALPKRGAGQRPTAFLTVQEGCDKFCTYCVVPYTRGAEISRPYADLIAEARALVEGGAREITLLGQNVNAWDGEDDRGRAVGLDGLIRDLARVDGLERIRYTTSHPNDMTDGLIAAHGEIPQLMPYLHLPVQAGSDRILAAMNRSHSVDSYLRVIERVRAVRPDIAISGDFIVGFPSESEEDFQATLDLIHETRYAMAYSFKYSRRPGTPAATMDGQISEEAMHDRLQRLQALLNEQQHAFNAATVGKATRLLLERKGKLDGQLIGKTPWLQSAHVIAPGLAIGDMVDVRIAAAGPNSLTAGLLVEEVA